MRWLLPVVAIACYRSGTAGAPDGGHGSGDRDAAGAPDAPLAASVCLNDTFGGSGIAAQKWLPSGSVEENGALEMRFPAGASGDARVSSTSTIAFTRGSTITVELTGFDTAATNLSTELDLVFGPSDAISLFVNLTDISIEVPNGSSDDNMYDPLGDLYIGIARGDGSGGVPQIQALGGKSADDLSVIAFVPDTIMTTDVTVLLDATSGGVGSAETVEYANLVATCAP